MAHEIEIIEILCVLILIFSPFGLGFMLRGEIDEWNETYRIGWYAIETGKTGHGELIFESEESAKLSVDSLNLKNKGITYHWCERWPTR